MSSGNQPYIFIILLTIFVSYCTCHPFKRIIIYDEDPIYLSSALTNFPHIFLPIGDTTNFISSSISFWFKPNAFNTTSSIATKKRILAPSTCPPGWIQNGKCPTSGTTTNTTTNATTTATTTSNTFVTDYTESITNVIEGDSNISVKNAIWKTNPSSKQDFFDRLKNQQSALIFETYGNDNYKSDGKIGDKNFVHLAYGSNYFSIKTKDDSFDVQFDDLQSSNWMFVCISIDYNLTGTFQLAVFSPYNVLLAKTQTSINKDNQYFYNGYIGVGMANKKDYQAALCNCYISNMNWYLDIYLSNLFEIMNMKKKDMIPIFVTNFDSSSDITQLFTYNSTYFSMKNTKLYAPSTLMLGDTINAEASDPIYDKSLMGLTFIDSQQKAIFSPGYLILQNNACDFTVSFWFKIINNTNFNGTQTIFANQYYDTSPLIKIYLSSSDNKNFYLYSKLLNNSETIVNNNTLNAAVWYFYLARVRNNPEVAQFSILQSFGTSLGQLLSKDVYSLKSNLTWNNFQKQISTVQRFILGAGFIGSIKNFRFYHGTLFFNRRNESNQCFNCNLCLTTYPYWITNSTIGSYLNLSTNDCLFCNQTTSYTGISNCSKTLTSCPANFANFLNTTKSCEYSKSGSYKPSTCKNGEREGSEVCDDDNSTILKGCSDDCLGVKPGFLCSPISTILKTGRKIISDSCKSVCGDGIVTSDEECDLGSATSTACVNCTLTSGYFCANQTCKICTPNCQKCKNMMTCQVCNNGTYLLSEIGICISSCGNFYYEDSVSQTCKNCSDSNCLKCNSSTCQLCNNSTYLYNGNCLSNCPNYTYQSSTGFCMPCNNSYCLSCSNGLSNGCLTCLSSSYFNKGTCVTQCSNNQYLNTQSRSCIDCSSNCQKCTKDACYQCISGYHLKTGICVTLCGDGYLIISDSSCSLCSEYHSGFNCLTCDETGCLMCSTGNILSTDYRCQTSCGSGYFANITTRQCQKCIANCQDCASTTSCNVCSLRYYLDMNSVCVQACPNGYYADTTSGKCIVCKINFCQNCSLSLETCSKCNTSQPYYNPIAKSCELTITKGFYLSSPVNNSLIQCNSSCKDCSGPVFCSSCNSGYLIDSKYCVNSIALGYYPSNVTGVWKLEKCQLNNCDKCDISPADCTLCSQNYFYLATNHTCYLKCGDQSYYYDTTARTCTLCSDSNCISCSHAQNQCDVCNVNYYLNSLFQCVNKCDLLNGISLTTQLINIDPLSSVPMAVRICVACSDKNCNECYANYSYCSLCKDKYYILNGNCVDKSQYINGYYVPNESPPQLKSCIDIHCETCSSPDSCCTKCAQGYTVNGCNCVNDCPNAKYKDNNNVCQDCPSNCDSCISTQNSQNSNSFTIKCTKCSNNYYQLNWTDPFICDTCSPSSQNSQSSVTYYSNTFNNVNYCGKCPIACKACTEVDNCATCVNNYYLFYMNGKGSCVGICPNGTYLDSSVGECKQCTVTDCIRCSKKDQCSECKHYLLDNACSTNCQTNSGYYTYLQDGYISICAHCASENCGTCSNDGSICIQCKNQYYLQEGICLQSCGDGYYAQGFQCLKCMEYCQKCDKANNCDLCDSKQNKYKFLSSGDYTCQSPISGMYLNSTTNTLENCISNCAECNSSTECITPTSGYVYDITTKKCQSFCLPGTYLSSNNKTCLACPQNCGDCSSEKCNNCTTGYVLTDSNTCLNSCPDQYSPYYGICYKCPDNSISCQFQQSSNGKISAIGIWQCKAGFYLIEGVSCASNCPNNYYKSSSNMSCLNCLNNCQACLNNSVCETCSPNFFLTADQTHCLSKTDCQSQGLFLDEYSNQCLVCGLKNCQDCLDLKNCLICEDKFPLYISECVNQCPDGFFDDSNICKPCKIANCKDCSSNSSLCDKCFPQSILTEDKTNCVSNCGTGFVSDLSGENCIKCGSNCDQCANDLQNFSCITPSKNFYLLPPSSFGISKCPAGYYSDENRILYLCVPNCLQCTNLNDCSKCNETAQYYLDQANNKCTAIADVSQGYYVDQTSGTIEKCIIQNCISCISLIECEICNDGYIWDSQNFACVTQCPQGSGTEKNTKKCEKCIDLNCESCKNSEICEICKPNYLIIEDKSSCTQSCPDNYYNNMNGTCKTCQTGCLSCLSASVCNICDPSSYIICEGSCLQYVKKNENSLKQYFDKCPLCLSENYPCPTYTYFNESGNSCHKCHLGCLQCNISTCFQCGVNSTLIDGNCYRNCPDFTHLDKSTNLCINCPDFCKNCSHSGECLECADYFEFDSNGSCVVNSGYYVTVLNETSDSSTSINDINLPDYFTFVPVINHYTNTNPIDVNIPDTTNITNITNTTNSTLGNTTIYKITTQNQSTVVVIKCPIENCLECPNSICTVCAQNYTLFQSINLCVKNCDEYSYLDSSSLTCKTCNYPCQKCESAQKCTSCATNYKLNSSNSCVAMCGSHCDVCDLPNICKICSFGFIFQDNACKNCSEIQGLGSDCLEICGDGILLNSSLDGKNCDDGNNIDGDGCSKNCKTEDGFVCKLNSTLHHYVCYNNTPFELAIVLKKDKPETIQIKTSRKLHSSMTNDALSKRINFKIPQLDLSSYNYSIDYDVINGIFININYTQSVQNIEMSLIFIKAKSRVLQLTTSNMDGGIIDENGVSISDIYYEKPQLQSLYPYKAYSTETKQQADTIKKAETTASIAFIVSTGPLYIFQAFSMFWLMVDCIQISYFLQFINTDYPINLDSFLKILSNANLNFIPNPFDSEGELINEKIVNQVAPKRFNDLGLTSSFMQNAGSQMLLFIITFSLFFTVLFIDIYLTKNKKQGKIAIYTRKIRDTFEYSGILRVFLMVYLQLCLGSMLQIRNPDASNIFNGFSSFLGFLAFIILILMFIALFKVINSPKFDEETKKKKFSILYEDYKKDTFLQKNYPTISVFKKFLNVLILVTLHGCPKIEILMLMILFLSSFVLLVVTRPFERRLTNLVMAVTEMTFVAIFCLIGYLIYLEDRTYGQIIIDEYILERQVTIGWAVIWILCSVFSLYFIIYLRQQILVLRDLANFLKDFKIKYNEYLKNMLNKKNPPNRLKLIGSFLSKATMKEEEPDIETDPVSQIDFDQIDEKCLDLENMTEKNFSKFYKKFKSRTKSKTDELTYKFDDLNTFSTIGSPNSEERKKVLRQILIKIKEKHSQKPN